MDQVTQPDPLDFSAWVGVQDAEDSVPPHRGRFPAPGLPLSSSRIARAVPRRAPELGEHTEEILADVVGLGDRRIAELLERAGVAGARPFARAEGISVRR